jgi:Methylmalonyl-CoA mutase.
VVVGVNQFVAEEKLDIETLKVREEVEREQIEKVEEAQRKKGQSKG